MSLESIIAALGHAPFLMTTQKDGGNGHRKVEVRMQRVMEAVVIAGVLALFGYVLVIPKLETAMNLQFLEVKKDIGEIKGVLGSMQQESLRHEGHGHNGMRSRIDRLEQDTREIGKRGKRE